MKRPWLKKRDSALDFDIERSSRNRSEALEKAVGCAVDMLESGLSLSPVLLPAVVKVVVSKLRETL